DSQHSSAAVLGNLGPLAAQAVPNLLRGAKNTNDIGTRSAIDALGDIRAEPETVVPVLATSLRSTNAVVMSSAMWALEKFGVDAKPAVPQLLALLRDEKYDFLREDILNVLKRIDPEAAANAGVK